MALILRSEIGRRLTVPEIDGNFTYLENLAKGLTAGVTIRFPDGATAFDFSSIGTVSVLGDILPYSNNVYNLGSTTSRWNNIYTKDLYVASQSIYIGDLKLSSEDGVLLVNGNIISSNNGSIAINTDEVGFGTGTGLTSSGNFKFNSTCDNFIQSKNSTIATSSNSTIIGGACNTISGSGNSSTMFSTIVGGYCNTLYKSCNSNIFGGCLNNLGTSSYSSIVGGRFNTISGTLDFSGKSTTMFSTIIGGFCNTLSCFSNNSSIVGGYCNTVYSINSSILGGFKNTVSCNSNSSSILGGSGNSIASYSSFSSIVGGGSNNTICGVSGGSSTMFSTIVGGQCNTLSCSRYSIVGGQCNTLSNSCNSAIIGGVCLTLTSNNCTVLVPNLLIAGSMSPNCGTNFGITDNIIITGSASLCFVNGILISVGP